MASRQETEREYLDLAKDPVIDGGITPAMAARAQAMGWTRAPLTTAVYAHVQFRNAKNEIYYRDGWVKAGTQVFSKQERAASVFEDFEMVGGCGNVMIRYQ
jgi:hypothetical protein